VSHDILQLDWKFPSDEVYILAPGPNGKAHYDRIPADAWVIGVNKAIMLREQAPISIWLCADGTLPKQKWFVSEVNSIIQNNSPLSDSHITTPCFDAGALLRMYPDVPYHFRHGQALRKSPKFAPEQGVLRAGGSISAQAVQLAYWLGAKRIVLVGVDMAGGTYFDGMVNLNPRLLPDGTSKHCRMLNGLCQWLKARGVDVVSLSPTALGVKAV